MTITTTHHQWDGAMDETPGYRAGGLQDFFWNPVPNSLETSVPRFGRKRLEKGVKAGSNRAYCSVIYGHRGLVRRGGGQRGFLIRF